jgi:hypothetical protein
MAAKPIHAARDVLRRADWLLETSRLFPHPAKLPTELKRMWAVAPDMKRMALVLGAAALDTYLTLGNSRC